jgi:hypothetical protein
VEEDTARLSIREAGRDYHNGEPEAAMGFARFETKGGC